MIELRIRIDFKKIVNNQRKFMIKLFRLITLVYIKNYWKTIKVQQWNKIQL